MKWKNTFIELNRRFLNISESDEDSEESAFLSYADSLLGKEAGISWNELLKSRIVVILGEPGSGKTWEIRNRARVIRAENKFGFFLELERLVNTNLNGAIYPEDEAIFFKWKQSRESAHFFLDSVDEAKIRRQQDFGKALDSFVRGIGISNLHRIHVIISSRISEWRAHADWDEMIQRFGISVSQKKDERSETNSDRQSESDFRIVKLMPLNRIQVQNFAVGIGLLKPNDFIEALDMHHAWEFARRPIDVSSLMSYWQAHGSLGNLKQLIEFDLDIKLKETIERTQNDPLTPQLARRGAECLAAAVSMCQCFTFLVPDTVSTVSDKLVLDASECLPSDWTPLMKKSLLARAVFDAAGYGRIRFHHRRVVEYLTACWFEEIMRQGCPYPVLEDILFSFDQEQWILRPNLRPIAAWLAIGSEIWNQRIRERILTCAPDLFLSCGDPELLKPEYKKYLLQKLIDQYADRKHVYIESEVESLSRLACTDLASFFTEKVRDKAISEDIRSVILSMIRYGRITGCSEAILNLIADPDESKTIKIYAVAAIRDIGDHQTRQKLAKIILAFDNLDSILCGYLCKTLYPDVLDPMGLSTLVKKAASIPQKTGLPWILKRHIQSIELSAEQKYELLKAMVDLVEKPSYLNIGDRETSISKQFYWLGGFISELLSGLLKQSYHTEKETNLASRTIRLMENYRKQGMCHEAEIPENEIEAAIENATDARIAYFRWKIEEYLKESKSDTKYFFIFYHHSFLQPKEMDIIWLLNDMQKETSREKKLFVLKLCINIWYYTGRNRPVYSRIKQTVKNDRELLNMFRKQADNSVLFGLKNWLHRFTKYEWKNISRKYKVKYHNLYLDYKDQIWLYLNLHKLRKGEAIYTLGLLAREAREDHRHWGAFSWKPLISRRGSLVAKAAGEGWKISWRKFKPPIPHENLESNKIDWRIIIGLSGINVELEEGSLSFKTITADEARIACRYAINEMNGFAAWLPELSHYHPEPVKEILTECIKSEWQIPSDKEHVHIVLSSLCYEKSDLAKIVKDDILQLLHDRDPQHYIVLENALAVLLKHSEPPRSSLGNIAAKRSLLQSEDDPRFMLWLAVWLQTDAEPALKFLQKSLKHSQKPDRIMLNLCSFLSDFHNRQILVKNPDYLKPSCLWEFVPLVFEYIRVEDDIDRRDAGVHTPTERDDAQHFRNRLLERTAEIEEPLAYEVLCEFAENPLIDQYRDWILHLIKKWREKAAKLKRWLPSDIPAFMRNYEINPRSDHDLFKIICNRLICIKDEVEKGEISSRSDLHLNDDEAALRNWLARQLSQRSNGFYNVLQEVEIDLKQRPDLRVEASGINPISIEIKWADHWSIRELTDGLIVQLVGQYLRSRNSNYGIYILGNKVKNKYWKHPETGSRMFFDEIVQYFEAITEDLIKKRNDINGLKVFGIIFVSPQHLTTKT